MNNNNNKDGAMDKKETQTIQPRPSAEETDPNGVPLPATLPVGVDLERPTPRHNPSVPLPSTRGDFAGDLHPADLDPLRVGPARPAGNLMGRGHPMFTGGGQPPNGGGGLGANPNDDYRSGFGMRPRFDPFGPPGGPQQVYPGRGDPPRGGRLHVRGEPNPDHLEPPDCGLGSNYDYL